MERLIAQVEAQRAKLRRLFFTHGVLTLLVRALLAGALLYGTDYFVDPPRAVRLTLSLGAFVILGWSTYRHLIYPLRRRLDLEDMALAVERRFPGLDGSLISGLQFHRRASNDRGDADTRNVSPALLEAALDEAGGRAAEISWKTLFDTKGLRRLFFVTVVLYLLAAAYVAVHPTLTGIWVVRSIGGDLDWPRRTTLLIHLEGRGENFKVLEGGDPSGTQQVIMARGTSLPIKIEVEGSDPGEVDVIQDSESLGRLISRAVRRGDGAYRYRFRNVREPLSFRARGGDDDGQGREVEVQVVVPPEVTSVFCEYRYPDYLGRENERRDTAQIEGPEGTHVTANFTLSDPVTAAALALRLGGTETLTDLVFDSESPRTLRHEFFLEKSGAYRLRLTGSEGFANMDAPLHAILVRKDQAPRVRLFSPSRSDLDICARGVVVLRAVAEDDYGVARAGVRQKPAGREKADELPFTEDEADAPFGSRRIAFARALGFRDPAFRCGGDPTRSRTGGYADL